MKILRDESGQAVWLVALSLTCILGFVGLATDVGMLLHTKRNLQIAADAGAIAGASALNFDPTNVQADALRATAANGMTNGVGGVTVSVVNPVTDGYHLGSHYVEVVVWKNNPVFFLKLFNWGPNQNAMTVAARAVATNGAVNANDCLIALNSSGADTIHLQGSFDVSVPGCGVVDDSGNGNAMVFTGAGGVLSAGSVGVVGGVSGATGDSHPAPVTGVAPVSDPFGSVPAPIYNPASCTAAPGSGTWGSATPGVVTCYSGNITIHNAITMNPGTYVFTGTLDFTGNGSLTGTGVTLYIAPGGTLGGPGNGNTTLSLTAPTSGVYNGILIYQDRANTNLAELNGTPVATFVGDIYIPNAELELSGNTTMNLTTDLVVGSLYDKGNATINITDYSRTVANPPLTVVALVE